ncbi:MAG: stage II sporulation protein R [Eubacterium sp.]
MKKKLYVFVPIFLCALLVVVSITPTITMSESISQKVFRLHILANSDSEQDQQLKLRVRDKMLDSSVDLYSQCNSVEDAVNVSKNEIAVFKETARKVIAYYGYDYDVRAYVTKEYFETREYDGFTLPAGVYDCLKIEIGEGKGHNWWCVMYPSVCLSGCTDDFDSTLTDEEKKLIEADDYVVKFKIVEIYEKFKSKLF